MLTNKYNTKKQRQAERVASRPDGPSIWNLRKAKMYLASTSTLKYILQFLILFQGVLAVFIYGITFQKLSSKDGTISGLTRLEKPSLPLLQSQFPSRFKGIITF